MSKKSLQMNSQSGYKKLLADVSGIIAHGRTVALKQIDTTQTITYWFVGKKIVEFYQHGQDRAEYGEQVLIRLSRDLNTRFGKGYSVDNLQNMRRLYIEFPKIVKIYETVSRKSETKSIPAKYETSSRILSWSHYCELMKEDNLKSRAFYEIEALENGWSMRELRRQMDSMLYERLALSPDENPPIGLILCAKKDEIFAKYVLGSINNKIFASKYKLALPTEKELDKQLTIKETI